VASLDQYLAIEAFAFEQSLDSPHQAVKTLLAIPDSDKNQKMLPP